MNEKMNKAIAAMEGDLINTLQKWIRIPSVKGEPADGAPFGVQVRRALEDSGKDIPCRVVVISPRGEIVE